MWNERYAREGFAYGTEPNDFLRDESERLKEVGGDALCLCAGEGRNAVYLAGLGAFKRVVALDQSQVGLDKAKGLADKQRIDLEVICSGLDEFDLGESKWNLITSIFGHLPPALRKTVHARVVKALRPGGLFVAELYSPAQLGKGTGGPPVLELLVSADMVREELSGLEFVLAVERDRDIHEGEYHKGLSSVTQIIARKPSA